MSLVTLEINNFYDYDVKQLDSSLKKAKTNNQKTLPLIINSYGGSVHGLFRMIDLIKASGLRLITICHGVAMSAGSILFGLGEERYMTENSSIMIHDASFWSVGKHSDIKSISDHVGNLQDKAYAILDNSSKKEAGFFENLVKENKGADLYLTANKALELGLVTEIGIPSIERLQNIEESEKRTTYQNFNLLMKKLVENKNDFLTKNEEVARVYDLNLLLKSLDEDQKKPIIELQKQLSDLENKSIELSSKLTEKEKALDYLSSEYEHKFIKLTLESDKDFIQNLIKNMQLSKANEENELKMLSALNDKQEIKQLYKDKLSKANKVVQDSQIPDSGERDYQFENIKPIDAIKQIAKDNNLDISNSSDVIEAQMIYAKTLGGN